MGGTGLILRAVDSKVNYSVLHLDFQGISMSPVHVLNPQRLSVRGRAKVPVIQMSNTPGDWVLLNSTLNTVHSTAGGNAKWHSHFGNYFGSFF